MGLAEENDGDDDEAAAGLAPGAADELRLTLGPDASGRLDKALAAVVPEGAALSRTRLARALAEGAVTCDGLPVTDAKTQARPGTYVVTLAPPEASHALPEAIPLDILHEDADLIVVNKPAGMVVHPAPGAASGTLVNALLHHCGPDLEQVGGLGRPGIVHRIDKDTTGLLVAAKTVRAHAGLSKQFAAHSVTRRYLALVHALPSVGDPRLRGLRGVTVEPGGVIRVATHLDRHHSDRQRQAVTWESGRHAVTRFRVLESFGENSAALVECWLETGRTHQIRVHMAYLGHGLIGDATYGASRKLSSKGLTPAALAAAQGFPRQALHAATLGFDHPAGSGRLEFAAPLPADMEALLSLLRAKP